MPQLLCSMPIVPGGPSFTDSGRRQFPMTCRKNSTALIWMIAAILTTAALSCCLRGNRDTVFDCPVDERTAVRFFYYPGGDYYHFPMVFRAVARKDTRLNTVQGMDEGTTAY